MIRFVVDWPHRGTLKAYQRRWRAGVPIRIHGYGGLLRVRRPPPGVWVFTDLERLGPGRAEEAALLHARLTSQGRQVLNHPTRTMRRHELLKTLFREGANSFDCHRVDQPLPKLRYPVFLRREDDHHGPMTGLLEDDASLSEALAAHYAGGGDRRNTIVVEWADTRFSDGMNRKYSAFVIAGKILPRHLMLHTSWVAKTRGEVDSVAALEEERRYFRDNPHARELAAAAETAGVEYGRIDYGVGPSGLEVWEINTNPVLFGGRDRETCVEVNEGFRDGLAAAWRELLNASARR